MDRILMNNKAIRMIFFIIIPPLWIEGILILVYPGFFKGKKRGKPSQGRISILVFAIMVEKFPPILHIIYIIFLNDCHDFMIFFSWEAIISQSLWGGISNAHL
jgi:hypothetical protein